MKKLKKVKPLQRGDTIGIIALSSAVKMEKLQQGVANLEQLGFRVRVALTPSGPTPPSNLAFSSDSAENRADGLLELLRDPEVKVVISARGGFGALELLPLLDFQEIREAGKAIVGFSDLTALLAAVIGETGLITVHGACVGVEFASYFENENSRASVDSLLALLGGEELPNPISCQTIRAGNGKGRIIAGNLTLLTTLLGTPWDLDYGGAILLVEEVNEQPYRVHRMLTQLKLAGKLEHLAAFIFGRFSRCDGIDGALISDYMWQSVTHVFADSTYPIGCGFPFGHEGINSAVPLGVRAEFRDGQLSFLESPVSESQRRRSKE